MEIDLIDGLFGIYVHETPLRMFGFTHGAKRYRWTRLSQVWKWSMVLFHERVAESVSDLPCLQYADNVLIGEGSLEELREIAHKALKRFYEHGIKATITKWVSITIQFLSYEMCNDSWSHKNLLKRKCKQLGEQQDNQGPSENHRDHLKRKAM